MRRRRAPSDSPSIVTRPGVNSTSIELWVTSIHAGIASGRQFVNRGGGRPARSSANWNLMYSAAGGVHGGILVLTCASWSVILGFHTPLQSGSLARSAQSFAVGGGLMTDLALGGGSAASAYTPPNPIKATKIALQSFFIGPVSSYVAGDAYCATAPYHQIV